MFPIIEGAKIFGVIAIFGEQKIECSINEKQEAKRVYDKATKEGDEGLTSISPDK